MTKANHALVASGLGILLAQLGGCLVHLVVPHAQAAWGWGSSPSPPPMPPSPPPPSPPPPSPPSPPPVSCGTWGNWGTCSVTCGSGQRTRTRGGSCAPYSESETCDLSACPEPCGQWSQWASCPVTCGGGTRSRSREGGCSSFTESEACNSNSCPVSCDTWGQWSSCSASCGGGMRSRSRSGDASCGLQESEACNSNSCPTATNPPTTATTTAAPGSGPSAASCGVWQQWSACTASCGQASRMRSRGGECQPFVESEACSLANCPAPSPPPTNQAPVTNPPATTAATTTAAAVTSSAASATSETTVAAEQRPVTSDVVEVRMRIASDFSNAAKDIDSFRSSFRDGMAAASGVAADRIIVNRISPGSIIVDFVVTGADQLGQVSAAEAVQDLEKRLADQTYTGWPASLQSMMAQGAAVQAKSTRKMSQEDLDAMALLSSGSSTVFLTPEAGMMAPAGCNCISGQGISEGCAQHRGISPAWCLVANGCREAMEGVLGPWAFCVQSTDAPSADRNRMVIASGNGSAVRITWLLVAIFVQGLLW